MIRALVVDDEELARQHLVRLLRDQQDVEVAGEAANGYEALERIEEKKPDLVFLDIEMPGFDGFEVLENLADPPLIVFATAYDRYAIRAFEANALDYLLKPIQADRVTKCLDRVRKAMSGGGQPAPMYANLLSDLAAQRGAARTRLAVRRGKRIIVLPVSEVLYIGLEDKLTFVYTDKERFFSDKNLGQLEEALAGSGFFRISRSDIVNVDAVRELLPWFSGTYKVKLTNNTELDVSRERARELKALLGM